MTFEQKLKAAALEAALHPALRHAAKNPARTARNLVEFTAGVAGCKYSCRMRKAEREA